DLEVGRSRIAPGAGRRGDRPLLLRLRQVVRQANVDVAGGPLGRNLRDVLRRDGGPGAREDSSARTGWTSAGWPGRPRSDAAATHCHTLHAQLERRTCAHGLDRVRARREVVAGHGPAVPPQERPNVEHAGAPSLEVGFVVQRESLYAIPEVEQAEMAGADDTASRPHEQRAAAADHVDA